MLSLTVEKLDQARHEIRERKDRRNAYVKTWRQSRRIQRRKTIFVEEYVRAKFAEVYSEAIDYYSTLDQIHPKKIDLCKTREFRAWRASLNHKEKSTEVQQPIDNMVLNIPLLPHIPVTPAQAMQASVEPTAQPQPETVDTPPEIGAQCTVEMSIETPQDFDITDSRIREIVAELQDDPALRGILDDFPSNNQIDEGIEVPNIIEDIETDLESDPFW